MATVKSRWSAGKNKPSAKRLRNPELLRIAIRFVRLGRLKKRAEGIRAELQKALLGQLALRKADQVHIGDVTITRAQATAGITYEQAGLLKALKPSQRKVITRESIDLNRLPIEVRQRLEATLSKEERSAIATVSLDVEALKTEIEAGRIDAALVETFTRKQERAPYVVVTGV
jgi:hypothetical protein